MIIRTNGGGGIKEDGWDYQGYLIRMVKEMFFDEVTFEQRRK